jgi:hypothetical protein
MFYMSVALSGSRLAGDRIALVLASLAAIWIALGTNLIGVNIGKWTENLGALAWPGNQLPSAAGIELGHRELLGDDRLRNDWP